MSALLSFPLGWLYELAGRTLWAPALVHAAIQAGAKLVLAGEPERPRMMLAFMACSMAAPWLVFLVRRPASTAASRSSSA